MPPIKHKMYENIKTFPTKIKDFWQHFLMVNFHRNSKEFSCEFSAFISLVNNFLLHSLL